MKFGEKTKKLKVGGGGIDEDLEELIKKIKEEMIMKKKRKGGEGKKVSEMGNAEGKRKKWKEYLRNRRVGKWEKRNI